MKYCFVIFFVFVVCRLFWLSIPQGSPLVVMLFCGGMLGVCCYAGATKYV